MPARALAVTIGDKGGALAPKIETWLPLLTERFDVFVQATTVTHPADIAALRAGGADVVAADPDFNLIGLHRREAVRRALSGDPERVVYLDLDHALRLVEKDAAEFDRVLVEADSWECTVIGRGPSSWAALPARLAQTESIVNRVYEVATGRSWDLLMAARSLSPRAAHEVVARCRVDSIGNDTAWPLHCERAGLSVGYVAAEALVYRTNEAYALDLEDGLDRDPVAWARRVQIAWIQVEAMLPYLSET